MNPEAFKPKEKTKISLPIKLSELSDLSKY
jgi:hypothetical protein